MSDNLTNGENAEEVEEVVGEVAVEAAAEATAESETELVADSATEPEATEPEEPEATAEPVAEADATTEATAEPIAEAATEAAPESAAPEPAADNRPAETNRTGPTGYVESEGGRPSRIGSGVKVSEVDYKNIAMLSRFLDRRGRILSRRKTRVSAKVQRRVAQAIKRARHLALLPYTSDQTRVVRKRR